MNGCFHNKDFPELKSPGKSLLSVDIVLYYKIVTDIDKVKEQILTLKRIGLNNRKYRMPAIIMSFIWIIIGVVVALNVILYLSLRKRFFKGVGVWT